MEEWKSSLVEVRISVLTYTYYTSPSPTAGGVPAIISLPAELFNQVPPADRRLIGLYFSLYENAALFPTNLSAVVRDNVKVQETFVGTPIVGATVGPGIDFVTLDPPVVITLGLLPLPANASVRTKYTANLSFLCLSILLLSACCQLKG